MMLGGCKGRKVTSCIKSTGEQIKPELSHQNIEIVDEGYQNIIQKSIATLAGKMHTKMFLLRVSYVDIFCYCMYVCI